MTLHPEQCRHQDVPGKTGCRIAGVVVLYRPDEEVTATISTYIEQVDMLIAIDNSEYDTTPTTAGLRQLDTVTFVANGRNLGVAGALNMGARMALECGCEYLLTMDQDSRATPGMVLTMLRVFSSSEQGAIGIVAPFLVTRPGEKPDGTIDCLEMQSVMTSGNLLNLRAYEAAGPFIGRTVRGISSTSSTASGSAAAASGLSGQTGRSSSTGWARCSGSGFFSTTCT